MSEIYSDTRNQKKLKQDKVSVLEKLLDNVKAFDQNENIVNIELTTEQKEAVIKQYNESFDESIKNIIENNPDEFEELFIANNYKQFENLFPSTYIETIKEQSVNSFKNYNVMEAVRYGLAYTESMKSSLSRRYVNNGKYKTLLVFNNNKNILLLSTDNIKKPPKNEDKAMEIQDQKKNKEKVEIRKMSILIKLSGNEKETHNGIYLPVNNSLQVFIPKELYKKRDSKLEILNCNSNQANMSEYQVNAEEHTKKWISRLSLEEFYHKYFKIYEIQMEKEVME